MNKTTRERVSDVMGWIAAALIPLAVLSWFFHPLSIVFIVALVVVLAFWLWEDSNRV